MKQFSCLTSLYQYLGQCCVPRAARNRIAESVTLIAQVDSQAPTWDPPVLARVSQVRDDRLLVEVDRGSTVIREILYL